MVKWMNNFRNISCPVLPDIKFIAMLFVITFIIIIAKLLKFS